MNYFGTFRFDGERSAFSQTLNVQLIKKQDMRYGENPHQNAAFYIQPNRVEASISAAIQIQGKALSYNNVADADVALECVKFLHFYVFTVFAFCVFMCLFTKLVAYLTLL